jgi:hypothetical protein
MQWQKTQADDIISKSVCALCGRAVHIDAKHGRITCNGCNQFTDYCTCDWEPAGGAR